MREVDKFRIEQSPPVERHKNKVTLDSRLRPDAHDAQLAMFV